MYSKKTSRRANRATPLLAAVLAIFGYLSSPLAAQSGYQIIVNDDNSMTSIEKSEISRIFLGKIASWPNGQAMRPVDLTADDAVRELFSKDVHGRYVPAIKNYWQRQIFSGRGTPPPELRSEEEVLQYVRSNPGGIGYVSTGTALGSGVKRLRIE